MLFFFCVLWLVFNLKRGDALGVLTSGVCYYVSDLFEGKKWHHAFFYDTQYVSWVEYTMAEFQQNTLKFEKCADTT